RGPAGRSGVVPGLKAFQPQTKVLARAEEVQVGVVLQLRDDVRVLEETGATGAFEQGEGTAGPGFGVLVPCGQGASRIAWRRRGGSRRRGRGSRRGERGGWCAGRRRPVSGRGPSRRRPPGPCPGG